MTRRIGLVSVLATVAGLTIAEGACAATQLGQLVSPISACGAYTFLQSSSPAGQYTVPYRGVITSWSVVAFSSGSATLKLKVGRPAGGNSFSIVGESIPEDPVDGVTPNKYSTQIPVLAGDVIGLRWNTLSPIGCISFLGGSGYVLHRKAADVLPSPTPIAFDPGGTGQLDISATLEPDADCDGLGDETQDPMIATCPLAPPGATGERAAALKKCKKKRSPRARKKCRRKAKLLPA